MPPDYITNLEPILMLMLGWAMGLLTPTITDKIRRKYRQQDVMRAVVDEFIGLQYTMCLVAYNIRARNAEVTDTFIDFILPLIQGYEGPERNERLIEGIRKSRERSEVERAILHQALRKPNSGLSLRQYGLPLFVSQIADLAICSLPFQRGVLTVRYHLDLFNQSVPPLQAMFDKTFDDLSADNRQIVEENMELGYRLLGERAEIVVQTIEGLKKLTD